MEVDGLYFGRLLVLDHDATELKKLTGMSLDELTQKFADGWTLKPPDPAIELAKELHELTEGFYDCLKETKDA